MFKNIIISALKQSSRQSLSRFAPNLKLQKINLFYSFQKYPIYYFTSTSDASTTQILEEVEAKVYQILKSAAKCKQDKLSKTATFEDLGFDSLDSVELVVAMEENFGFDITNEEAEKINNVQQAIITFNKYVVERLNKNKLAEMQQEKSPQTVDEAKKSPEK